MAICKKYKESIMHLSLIAFLEILKQIDTSGLPPLGLTLNAEFAHFKIDV